MKFSHALVIHTANHKSLFIEFLNFKFKILPQSMKAQLRLHLLFSFKYLPTLNSFPSLVRSEKWKNMNQTQLNNITFNLDR